MKIFSFPAISNEQSQVLVLGTMPSEQSLSMNQYYANSRNQFWKILFQLFNEHTPMDYDLKSNFLLRNKIAIWDVLQTCAREGSSDSGINSEGPNDFKSFFEEHPSIKLIAFNGQKAYFYFKRHVKTCLNIPSLILSSTSSARTIGFDKKIIEWKQIISFIN